MKRPTVILAAAMVSVTVLLAAVRTSRALNAALIVQDEVLALSSQHRYAEAIAAGHRYFASERRTSVTTEERMLLTTVATHELLSSDRPAATQTLDDFDRGCGRLQVSTNIANRNYAARLRRVVNGEPMTLLNARPQPSRDTTMFGKPTGPR